MLSFRFSRWIHALVCAVFVVAGCATTETSPGESGSLSLDLVIGDGIVINEVQWRITGNGMDMSGSIDVSAPGSTASVEVFGLPPGDEDYTVELTALSDDEEVSCKGSANFNVVVGESTDVMVMLNCKLPETLGGVRVNGKFNICAQLTKATAAPLQTSVGNDIDLSSQAEDADGDPIAYNWTATGGSIADPSAASTTYTCQEAGDHTITISVTDNDEYCDMATWTFQVTCVPGEAECQTNADCESGEVCVDGQCVPDAECDIDTDCADENQCTVDICGDGQCSNPNQQADFECDQDGGSVCDGDGACVECNSDAQCDMGEVCTNNACVADVQCMMDSDCDDSNDCTDDVCTAGDCSNPSSAADTACTSGGGSVCDGNGACVECNSDAQCAMGEVCTNNACVADAQCAMDSDCDDSNDCTDDVCTAGDCSNPNSAADTACTSGGGSVCDGNGACVECNADAQCAMGEVCTDNACVADVECTVGADCADGNDCTDDVCTAGVCSNPNSAIDTMCTSGGSWCDGNGNCVECNNDNQCDVEFSEVCVDNVCVAGTDCPPETASKTIRNACRNSFNQVVSTFPVDLTVSLDDCAFAGQSFNATVDPVLALDTAFLQAAANTLCELGTPLTQADVTVAQVGVDAATGATCTEQVSMLAGTPMTVFLDVTVEGTCGAGGMVTVNSGISLPLPQVVVPCTAGNAGDTVSFCATGTVPLSITLADPATQTYVGVSVGGGSIQVAFKCNESSTSSPAPGETVECTAPNPAGPCGTDVGTGTAGETPFPTSDCDFSDGFPGSCETVPVALDPVTECVTFAVEP